MNPRYEALVSRVVALRKRWHERFNHYGRQAEIELRAFSFYAAQLNRWRADALRAVGNDLNHLEIAMDLGGIPFSRIEAGVSFLESGLDRIDELETRVGLFDGSGHAAYLSVFQDFRRPPKDGEGDVIDAKTAARFRSVVPKPYYQFSEVYA